MIRLPRLLSQSLSERARLYPSALDLDLSFESTSQARMTLSDDTSVAMHDWVEIYTGIGSAGIYRVTNIGHDYLKQINLTLLHGIDVLTDQIYPGAVEFSGTVSAFLSDILSKQTSSINGQAFWVLGVCEDANTYKASINYDSLRQLLKNLMEHEQEFYAEYDMTSFPWVINIRRRSDAVVNEFRLARNVNSCSITMDDSEMCTRLYLSIDQDTANTNTGVKTTATTIRTYEDTAAQLTYGIIAKTAGINTSDYPDPDAFAQRFLTDRSKPRTQISIDGTELAQITGDTFDELKLGKICRVALPDYGETYSERIISIKYPDLINDPTRVTVELANSAYSAVSSISAVATTAATTAKEQKAAAQTAAGQIHTAKADLIKTDGVLHEAGIELDPTGVFVFAKEEGALGRALSFVDLSTEGGRVMFTDAFEKDASGKLVVKSAAGMSYRKNNVDVGLFDNDNLTTGIIIKRINGDGQDDSDVIIKATKVDLGAYATVGRLEAEIANIEELYATEAYVTSALGGSFTAMSIGANSLSAENVTGTYGTFTSLAAGGTTFGVHSLNNGNGTSVSFLSTGDITFDRAAAKAEGAAAVVVTLGDTGWVAGDAASGNYTRTITGKKDGVDTTAVVTVNAQTIWNLGWNAARAWSEARSHRVISGCTNLGTMELFSYNSATERYYSQGSHYWRYGGSAVTYYELPASK